MSLGLEIFTPRIYYIHLHANVSQSTIQGQSHLSKDFAKWEWELFSTDQLFMPRNTFFVMYVFLFIFQN